MRGRIKKGVKVYPGRRDIALFEGGSHWKSFALLYILDIRAETVGCSFIPESFFFWIFELRHDDFFSLGKVMGWTMSFFSFILSFF